jgi:hypothetical protein
LTPCAGEDFDFIPLKIDYQERKSAAGLTKGGYLKRDGRASDDEILVSRLIDVRVTTPRASQLCLHNLMNPQPRSLPHSSILSTRLCGSARSAP